MTIKEALHDAHALLKQQNFDINDGDAEILLGHVLGARREFLHLNPEQEISSDQKDLFFNYIHKRLKQVPVAQITGTKEFYGIDFIVSRDVLIPRPETELLVEESLKIINSFPNLTNVADIGTGSGCIAISVLAHSNNIYRMYATDISRKALKTAKVNAQRHEDLVKDRIVFLKGNLVKALGIIPIDVLIANLPYLTPDEYDKSPELAYEPRVAFDGKDATGTELYEDLFKQLRKRAQIPYYILLEIGTAQASEISKLAKKYLEVRKIDILKDLAGHDRVLKIALD